MFKSFKNLIMSLGDGDQDTTPVDNTLVEAAAVLLAIAAGMDGDFDTQERETAIKCLTVHFGISASEAAAMMQKAEHTASSAVEYSRYTIAIRSRYTQEQRVQIIEMLWEVVLADGEIHAYEANLLRRMGGLIYVSDRENGEARKRAEQRRNTNPGG